MAGLRQFRRKQGATIVAVRLDLDTDGFTYEKWGAVQHCKPGDWIVNNGGDTYTIDAGTFACTYREVRSAVYEKVVTVWAKRAEVAGTIQTREGATHYEAGAMLVFNDAELTDGYALPLEKFESLYEPMEP